jgi:hypothetical protein
MDEESGALYYRNNVSGDTQWEMPDLLDMLVCCPVICNFFCAIKTKTIIVH